MSRAQTDVARLTYGIEVFRQERGRYPTNEEGIEALIRDGFWRPIVYSDLLGRHTLSRDPWDRAYLYALPGHVHPDSFDVCTYGADGKPGGDEENADICNE